jgi:heme O synthase-like polyprenyltransferase
MIFQYPLRRQEDHISRAAVAALLIFDINKELTMKKNMNMIDRVIRPILAVLFFILYIIGAVTGVFGMILVVLGGVFVLTSIFGYCPIYTIFGRRTLKPQS